MSLVKYLLEDIAEMKTEKDKQPRKQTIVKALGQQLKATRSDKYAAEVQARLNDYMEKTYE